jgi:hypothetical protein
MADDEAEHSKTTAGTGLPPDSAPETPLSGVENQLGEPEAAEAESQPELETTAAHPGEAEPTAAISPAPHTLSGEQIRADADVPEKEEEPKAARAPEPAGYTPELANDLRKPRSRFPALAATAIAGGLLGLGGSFALRHFEGSGNRVAGSEDIAALTARLDAIEGKSETAAAAAHTALAALETRMDAAESAANKAADLANTAEADLQKDITARPPAQEPAAGPNPSNPSEIPDLGPLSARIGTIEQKLTSLESALAAPKAELRAAEQDRENPASMQGSRAHAIATVAQSLLLKLESGGQFPEALAALENLGVPEDSLGPLRAVSTSAVSSERQLATQFTSLAPAIIASDPANQASADENFIDRVTRHAKGLVHVRRIGGAEDTDVEGLVTRIETALADHDLDTAYKVWTELPSAAKTISEGWGEAVKARLDAFNAARSIEAGAVAVLGKPKP